MEATACTSTAIVVAAPVTDPSAIAACDFVDPPCEVPAGFAPGLARIIALTSSDLRHTWRLHAWSMKSCCASETLVIEQDSIQESVHCDKYVQPEQQRLALQFAFLMRPVFLRRWGDLVLLQLPE